MNASELFKRQTYKPHAVAIDSCVILSAMKVDEEHNTDSADFIGVTNDRGYELWCPATMLWEVGSTLDHPGKTRPGTEYRTDLSINFRYLPVDEQLFKRTWQAATAPVKAADRIFLSVAWALKAPLVTWDGKLINQAHLLDVIALTPVDFMRAVTGA